MKRGCRFAAKCIAERARRNLRRDSLSRSRFDVASRVAGRHNSLVMSPFRRFLTLLLLALLPLQGALASGGTWCVTLGGAHAGGSEKPSHSHDTASAHSHDGASASHAHERVEAATGVATSVDATASLGEHSTCSACAPCCTLALPGVSSLDASPHRPVSDDFLPVLVVLRPARPDGLERPPRTI